MCDDPAAAGALPVLELADWTVRFDTPDGVVEAVKPLSLTIRPGESLGIVGESGSGKSQLFLSAFGLLADNGRTTGDRRFLGQPLTDPQARLGRDVAFIFQDPLTSLTPHRTIGDQMAETLRQHQGLDASAARARCLALLERCRIPEAARRLAQYPHELSGGMRQRVMIAQAITTAPKLLIADEPTTALDMTVQAQILTLLRDLQAELGMAMAFISHDMGVIATVADRVAVMQRGRLIEQGGVDAVFASPTEPYTAELIAARKAPRAVAPQVAPSPAPVLAVKDLAVTFQVKTGWFSSRPLRAVDGVDFTLEAGECLGVVGESGCGKSTLARAVLGLIPRSAGMVEFAGRELPKVPDSALRRQLQIVFQDPFAALNPRMSVGEAVAEPLVLAGVAAAERQDRVVSLMRQVGLNPDWRNRYPHELSGGQNQRIGIARALACDPTLLVCDEAISALDATTAVQVLDLLADLQAARQLAMLFITHDLSAVARLAQRVIVLYLGRVVEAGPTATVLGAPGHPYTRQLLAAAPVADPAAMRVRSGVRLDGDLPSPLDPAAGLRFLKSRQASDPGYRPRLIEQTPGHWIAEHDPA
jgi:oligopeptide/dipeptide ABC transporter ATP-binding protein